MLFLPLIDYQKFRQRFLLMCAAVAFSCEQKAYAKQVGRRIAEEQECHQ